MKKVKKSKYLLIWILPFLLLIGSSIQFIRSEFIFKYISDHMKRLDGYALLIDAIIYFIGFIICASISIALTVIVYKKNNRSKCADLLNSYRIPSKCEEKRECFT